MEKWARPAVPDLLSGEDRSSGAGLFVDLVPSSCWFTDVRSCVNPQGWERLRRVTGVQALRRLICLCSDCHLSTHLGYADVTGRADQALAHLAAVTGVGDVEVSRDVHAAGESWISRSDRGRTLDRSMPTDAGVTPARPGGAADPRPWPSGLCGVSRRESWSPACPRTIHRSAEEPRGGVWAVPCYPVLGEGPLRGIVPPAKAIYWWGRRWG